MSKRIAWTLIVLMALAAISLPIAFVAAAQETATYRVERGDTLWDLSSIYLDDPFMWRQVVEKNPFLSEEGRQFTLPDGRFVVLIRPGEELVGLGELGIIPNPVPMESLGTPSPSATTIEVTNTGFPWWWLLIALAIGALAMLAWRNRRFFQNPTTSGVPMVEGGIRANQRESLERRFDQMANRRQGELLPTASVTDRPTRIGPIESGFLNGAGRVRYRDGREEPRRLRNEPAFRARFRFSNGQEEGLYFLQACANDVMYFGRRYQGFTFTPERVAVETPSDRSAGGHSYIAAIASSDGDTESVTVVVGGQELSYPGGSRVEVLAKNEIRVMLPSGSVTGFKFKAPRKPKAVKSTTKAEAAS